ncbi:Panacea domain-containing protein [Orientia tsutsugamushi]|uniref:Antitoxin SocA-like Panacea domain-containing protein n=2 Tax=Orientia tsutsugamushi TaxID=784 RepID=A0A0F3RLS8_ORITS|nr:type II toxin-antitoxin system antitoxin SocA domain-containing protein [Orientia tsutsugamushi]KJW07325.1 hypothetical protein OTUT144_0634 [Orientia tsutsugamushi str. UT144]SPR15671.1 Uncharacterised protein [Orientia tsutsugamushi]
MTIQQKGELLSCFDVASYFLVLVDRAAGDVITQLKLQKLVYFAQGAHLALFDKPLFKEDIEAWENGPEDYLLPVSKKDTAEIVNAEDQWWMNYDSGVS